MPESWHPRKTEKDVAVARTGVAKYDRGWKYGAGTHEHDHSKPRKGGEVLNPEQINNAVFCGADDDLQTKMNEAASGSKGLIIEAGTYTVSSRLVYPYGLSFMHAVGRETNASGESRVTIKLADGANDHLLVTENIENDEQKTISVDIKGISFDGNEAFQTGTGPYDTGMILTAGLVDSCIKENTFKNAYGFAFLSNAGQITGWGTNKFNQVGNTIKNNKFDNNSQGRDLLSIGGWVRGTIEDNRVLNGSGSGITTGAMQDTSIIGNKVYNCASYGISIEGWGTTEDNMVKDNIVRGCLEGIVSYHATGGVDVYKCSYSGNIVINSTDQGIHIQDNHGASIADNTVVGVTNFDGIRVEAKNGVTENNKIINNAVTGARHGINAAAGVTKVNDNLCYKNDQHGIDAKDNQTVVGNTCKNNGQGGGGYAGIHVYDNVDLVISGNRCFDDQGTKTQDYGILTENSSDYNIINGNNCRGNATSGISQVGANSVVTDNLP